MASDSATVKKVFKLPIWYIPSDTEIARLMSYIRSVNSEEKRDGRGSWTVARVAMKMTAFSVGKLYQWLLPVVEKNVRCRAGNSSSDTLQV